MLCGAAIVWYSQTQKCISHSSTESEYVALDQGCREWEYLDMLLQELGMKTPRPTIILNDNKSAKKLAESTVSQSHSRSKHIRVRYHYIRSLIARGNIAINHQHTDYLPADQLTKSLGELKHKRFTWYVLGLRKLDLVSTPL